MTRTMQHIDEVGIIATWDAVLTRLIEGERMTMAVSEVRPDAPLAPHRHQQEQLGIVIEGSLVMTIDDDVQELGPGGTWRVPSGAEHGITTGPSGAVIVDIFAPIRGDWHDIPKSPATPGTWPPREGSAA
jgi:quercetin dioxygenase-like cupin family protein